MDLISCWVFVSQTGSKWVNWAHGGSTFCHSITITLKWFKACFHAYIYLKYYPSNWRSKGYNELCDFLNKIIIYSLADNISGRKTEVVYPVKIVEVFKGNLSTRNYINSSVLCICGTFYCRKYINNKCYICQVWL